MLRSKFSKLIRNFFNIRPTPFLFDYSVKGRSVSDAFFWRVDENFKTVFKYSDILNIFYKKKSSKIKIIFYDSNFNLIKVYEISDFENYNTLYIDKKFLNLDKGFGSFYIFHESLHNLKVTIRNSCYTGYSYQNSIPSFVHGNLYSAVKHFDKNKIDFGLGANVFTNKFTYQVQNYMDFDKTEIIIINNCGYSINLDFGILKAKIEKGNTRIFNINKNKIVSIKSNAMLPRPLVFNYKEKYVDVYHG